MNNKEELKAKWKKEAKVKTDTDAENLMTEPVGTEHIYVPSMEEGGIEVVKE
jgi:hypothetical protein